MHRRTRTDGCHLQALDVKFQRQLARFQSVNDQLRMVADHAIDYDLYLASFGRHVAHLTALFPRRQIQLQSLHIDSVDMSWRTKNRQDPHPKLELRNANDGLKSGLIIVGVRFSKDSEPTARHQETLDHRNVE